MADWRDQAACRGEDPELFFPVGTSGPALLQIAEAKAVCRRCPVVTECLEWAFESGQDAGVWGGLSEDERRAHKQSNARPAARRSEVSAAALRAQVVERGTRKGATRAEVKAAGFVLLAAGASIRDVVTRLGVTYRTGQRWKGAMRLDVATVPDEMGEGSAA